MDTNSLREMISRRTSLPADQVDRFLVAFTECVGTGLKCNEDVVLEGFGIFHRPLRHADTPPFQFLNGGPVANPTRPASCHDADEEEPEQAVADFLRVNRVFDTAFLIDVDPFPELDPNCHPGVVTNGDVRESMVTSRRVVDPQMLADRVVENMRALIG